MWFGNEVSPSENACDPRPKNCRVVCVHVVGQSGSDQRGDGLSSLVASDVDLGAEAATAAP